VDEHEDRRVCPRRPVDIKLLDSGRAVGFAHRLPEPLAYRLAARGVTVDDLQPQRRVERLVIGRVELRLVHVHPDQRTLVVRGRADPALLRQRR
jgi:hypothetical protein